jgi:hypothetical protein
VVFSRIGVRSLQLDHVEDINKVLPSMKCFISTPTESHLCNIPFYFALNSIREREREREPQFINERFSVTNLRDSLFFYRSFSGKWMDNHETTHWSEGLAPIIFAINTRTTATTKKMPYQLVFGQDPRADYHYWANSIGERFMMLL